MNAITAPNGAKPPQQRRISKRVRHACELLISGECKTIKAAAIQANLSRERLSRALRESHVRTFCEERFRQTFATSQLRSGAVLEELMNNAASEHVRKDVARYFAELSGFVVQHRAAGPLVSIHNNICPGYVLDLRTTDEIKAGRGPLIEHNPPPRDDEAA